MQTLIQELWYWCVWIGKAVHAWLWRRLCHPPRSRWRYPRPAPPTRVFAQTKPKWVRNEIVRLKALMPQAGCRTIAHSFNRRWTSRRQITVSKTYVAELCRRQQYLIYVARWKLKHRVPRSIRRNRIWGCDLLVKTD